MKWYLAMYRDPDGAPRAWGASPSRKAATDEAAEQLVEYRAKSARRGSLTYAAADFTLRVEEVTR